MTKKEVKKENERDLDKIADQIYKTLKKRDLTVEEARSVTYRVNRKIAQNSKI